MNQWSSDQHELKLAKPCTYLWMSPDGFALPGSHHQLILSLFDFLDNQKGIGQYHLTEVRRWLQQYAPKYVLDLAIIEAVANEHHRSQAISDIAVADSTLSEAQDQTLQTVEMLDLKNNCTLASSPPSVDPQQTRLSIPSPIWNLPPGLENEDFGIFSYGQDYATSFDDCSVPGSIAVPVHQPELEDALIASKTTNLEVSPEINQENARQFAMMFLAGLIEQNSPRNAASPTTSSAGPTTLDNMSLEQSPATSSTTLGLSDHETMMCSPGPPNYRGRGQKIILSASEAKVFLANFRQGIDAIPERIDGYFWYCDHCYKSGGGVKVRAAGRFVSKVSFEMHVQRQHGRVWKCDVLPERDRNAV